MYIVDVDFHTLLEQNETIENVKALGDTAVAGSVDKSREYLYTKRHCKGLSC